MDFRVYEIIIVDNCSHDGTRETVVDYSRKNGNIRYVYEENLGTAYARNRGIRESLAPYIAFIDSDAHAARNWLETLLECFEQLRPSPDIIGGKVLAECVSKPIATWAIPYLAGLDYGIEGFYVTGPKPSHYFVSVNMAFRKKIFEQTGFFKTYLDRIGKSVRAGGETEFLLRALRRKFIAYYEPRAFVTHWIKKKRTNFGYLMRVAFMVGHANAVYTQEDYPAGWRAKRPLRRWVFKSVGGHLKELDQMCATQRFISYAKWLKICEEFGFIFGLMFSKRGS